MRVCSRFSIATLALALCLTPVIGTARTEFVLSKGGARVKDGEVCFYKVTGTMAEPRPESIWFGSPEMRCLSADVLMDIPPGVFRYFARHKGLGLISNGRYVVEAHEYRPETGVKEVELPLVPAGRVAAEVNSGEYLAAWTADSETASGALYRSTPGDGEVAVPADTPLIVMVVGSSGVRAMSEVLSVRAGELRSIRAFGPAAGAADLIIWLDADTDAISEATRANGSLKAPVISLATRDRTIFPAFPIRHAGGLRGAFVIFKNVPAERVEVRVEPGTWSRATLALVAPADRVTITSSGLSVSPAASLTVRIESPSAMVPLTAAKNENCSPSEADDAFDVELKRCARRDGLPARETECTLVEKQRVPMASAYVKFPGVTAPYDTVSVSHPKLGTITKVVTVRAGSDSELRITYNDARPVYGTVRRAGVPARALIRFAADSPYEQHATTDAVGAYAILLSRDPLDSLTLVEACDGSFRYTDDAPIEFNMPHDIAVPSNSITVTVRDAATRSAIARARVRYAVMRSGGKETRYARSQTSAEDGRVIFRDVTVTSDVVVCAMAETYKRSCADTFRLKEDESKSLELWLDPEGTLEGRVVGAEVDDSTFVMWTAPSGQVTEQCRIASDGRFNYKLPHGPGDYAIIVSVSKPLAVITTWTNDDGRLILNIPVAPSRSFTVNSQQPGPRVVGISVGGRPVPSEALLFHLNNRGSSNMVRRERPLVIRDILESAPLLVAISEMPHAGADGRVPDVFTAPEYRSGIITRPLGSALTIDFP